MAREGLPVSACGCTIARHRSKLPSSYSLQHDDKQMNLVSISSFKVALELVLQRQKANQLLCVLKQELGTLTPNGTRKTQMRLPDRDTIASRGGLDFPKGLLAGLQSF